MDQRKWHKAGLMGFFCTSRFSFLDTTVGKFSFMLLLVMQFSRPAKSRLRSMEDSQGCELIGLQSNTTASSTNVVVVNDMEKRQQPKQ